MDNGEQLYKKVMINLKLNGQSRMGNPETLATLDTNHTGRRQTKYKNTKQHKKLKRSATRTHHKPGVNPAAREG